MQAIHLDTSYHAYRRVVPRGELVSRTGGQLVLPIFKAEGSPGVNIRDPHLCHFRMLQDINVGGDVRVATKTEENKNWVEDDIKSNEKQLEGTP